MISAIRLFTMEGLFMAHFRADTTERAIFAAPKVLSSAIFLTMLGLGGAATAEPLDGARIGYVLTERHWAVYETEDSKAECPNGFNGGPREQFDELFPEDSKVERTVMETRLMREGRQFHPTTAPEPFEFKEVQGNISYGMNLDGKVDANDFQSPDGEAGIDNQLYRAIGCIASYRTDGAVWFFENFFMAGNGYTRWMIELTDVDSLENDDDVTVTTYRGLDELVTDASGQGFVSGGTQRVDARWGKSFINEVKGKIVDGVLTTQPIEVAQIPWSQPGVSGGYHLIRDLQLELKLTPQAAEGQMAGYVDVAQFTHRLNTNWATHHQSYGQLSSPSEYRALRKLADAYPDPETGANTAISSSVNMTLTQVYIVHPSEETQAWNQVASND